MHDTLTQGLTGIVLQLETADAYLEGNADIERVRQAMRKALTLAQENLQEARRSVLDLRAAPLEGRTLAEALANLTNELSADEGPDIELETVGGARPLPPRIEVGLYRIAQEALANVIRHSEASKAAVRLVTTPEKIELTVEDDGKGFEPSMIPDGHYGLRGISERARLLSGRMNLETSVGVGTRIVIVVPVEEG